MITAIIKNEGNTLTVELPQSVMDLEIKLSSIGSELSRDIHISDDPKSRITVKLISEGDIGEHLKKLFDSSHTLRDVNSLMHTIENASDEVMGAVGSDIINDRYVSPKKLADDIEKLKCETGQFTETLYFPLLGRIYDEECDDEYTVDNSYLVSCQWDISGLIRRNQSPDLGDMKEYLSEDEKTQAKMVTAKWGVTVKNGTLYGKVDIRLREPFTAEEKENIKDAILGQNSDGLGEIVEQHPIETEDGRLYVSMWDSRNSYFIYDEDEMQDYLSDQSGEMKL